jgi:hypothetical protein
MKGRYNHGVAKTIADRLNLLLPWLNGEREIPDFGGGGKPTLETDYDEIRRDLDAFASTLDGSDGAGRLLLVQTGRRISDAEIDLLEGTLLNLLKQALGEPIGEFTLPGARFQSRRVKAGVATALHGATPEAVPLAVNLLLARGTADARRCDRQGCDRFIVAEAEGVGRPRRFCSDYCRDVNRAEKNRKAGRKRR